MNATFSYLGALSPEQQNALEGRLGVLEGYHAQVLVDLTTLVDQGYDTVGLKSALDELGRRTTALRSHMATIDDTSADQESFYEQAEEIEASYRTLLARTGAARQIAPEQLQFGGLYWGFGVVIGAAILGAIVWRGRKKRRKG